MVTHKELKARQRAERESHSESVKFRVHRALSWLDRAEREKSDPDARFVFLWIAFNAAYAAESHDAEMPEKRRFQQFLRTLLELDGSGRIHHFVWKEFSASMRGLLVNQYVFADYWRHVHGGISAAEWEARFAKSRRAAQIALAKDRTLDVLSIVLARLYVLRNQLMHGGATWNGKVNRAQVRQAANLMGKLVPVVIGILLDHPRHDWGPTAYPVVNNGNAGS